MSNPAKYYLRNALYAITLMCFNGAIIQTFLSACGVSLKDIGMFTAASSVSQVVVMLFCSGIVDRIRDVKRACALFHLPMALFFLALIPLCVVQSLSPKQVFWLVLILGIVQNLFVGFRNILEYKLPYLIIPMEQYPRLVSVDGVISGFIGILASAAISFFLARLPYFQVMAVVFALCILFFVLCWILSGHLQVLHQPEEQRIAPPSPSVLKGRPLTLKDILKMKSFYLLILPNFIRGCSMGIMGVVAVIGINDLALSEARSAYIATAVTTGTILGGLIYALLSRRFTSRCMCMVGSVTMLLSTPLMLVGGSYPFFLAMLIVATVGQLIVGYAVPVMVTEFVPYEVMGRYTSWRLAVTTIGTAFANMVVGVAVGKVSSMLLLTAAGVLQMASGIAYFAYSRFHTRGEPRSQRAKASANL